MPTAPGSRCTEPGCGTLTTTGRCEKHARKPWANPSANSRALNGRQRATIRARQLHREPQCRVCGATENLEADHVIAIADGGAVWDPDNWQTLCERHHAAKRSAERLWAARSTEGR